MAKKASDDYIYLRKKICNIQLIHYVNELSLEWGLTREQSCLRILSEGIVREFKKKREIEELKKGRP